MQTNYKLFLFLAEDGWTANDLIYVWSDHDALQFAKNISLPGGFKMGDRGQDYCDVTTTTGIGLFFFGYTFYFGNIFCLQESTVACRLTWCLQESSPTSL